MDQGGSRRQATAIMMALPGTGMVAKFVARGEEWTAAMNEVEEQGR